MAPARTGAELHCPAAPSNLARVPRNHQQPGATRRSQDIQNDAPQGPIAAPNRLRCEHWQCETDAKLGPNTEERNPFTLPGRRAGEMPAPCRSQGGQTASVNDRGGAGLAADPFVIQASIGCQLHTNGTSRGICDDAVNGYHMWSFNMDAGIRVPRLQRKVLLYVQDLPTRDRGMTIMLQLLLKTACVNEIKSFFQHGKESLQRQEHFIAVVFAREPPPAGTPALLRLVCRVTGFYLRPVHVAWLQDGEEVAPGWRLNSTKILLSADLTYQLRSSLAVEPDDGHSYAWWVDHSSLGGQSLLIPWGRSRPCGGGSDGLSLHALAVQMEPFCQVESAAARARLNIQGLLLTIQH
ncbi:T-cell surface glycoprotein CD1b-3-like [Emydura macquarii macquarii]|uniref:T-cell surface glycoprotein CD1b-3-like n=1 Tax=Emydura macquarii macquarii TaxID=1129001 RepID=UPI00352B545D